MTDKVYAYFVMQSIMEPGLLTPPEDYVIEPAPNSVLLSEVNHGNGTHTISFEDGPIKIVSDLVYVGTGERDGKAITFDLGTKRILNLISIGLDFETVLTTQIHEFAEKAREKLEEVKIGPDTTGDSLRVIDHIEKHFFDRKR